MEYTNSRRKVIVTKTLSAREFDNFLDSFLESPADFEQEWPFDALSIFTLNPNFKFLKYKQEKKDRLMMEDQEY